MANAFLDSFLPNLTGNLAQIGPAAIQGHLQGLEASKQLALLDAQLRQQSLQEQQTKQLLQQQASSFPLQQQQLREQLAMARAPQPMTFSPGALYGTYNPLTGMQQVQGQVPVLKDPAQEAYWRAQAKEAESKAAYYAMLQGQGGMKPPSGIEELIKRKVASGEPLTPDEKLIFDRMSMNRPTVTEIMNPKNPEQAVKVDARTGKVIGESPRLAEATIPFAAKKKFEMDLASGVLGRQVIANNTAIAHLALLRDYAKALKSGNISAINKIKQQVQMALGIGEVPASMAAITPLVAGEIMKTVAAAGGGVEERLAIARAFSSALSPETFDEVVGAEIGVIKGKTDAIRNQYEAITQKKDFDTRFLTHETREAEAASQSKILQQSPLYQGTRQKSEAPSSTPKLESSQKEQISMQTDLFLKGEISEPIFQDYIRAIAKESMTPEQADQFAESYVTRQKAKKGAAK